MLDESRIQFIRENTDPKQWFYVPTKENPVDDSSRGLKDVHLEKGCLRVLDFYENQRVNVDVSVDGDDNGCG